MLRSGGFSEGIPGCVPALGGGGGAPRALHVRTTASQQQCRTSACLPGYCPPRPPLFKRGPLPAVVARGAVPAPPTPACRWPTPSTPGSGCWTARRGAAPWRAATRWHTPRWRPMRSTQRRTTFGWVGGWVGCTVVVTGRRGGYFALYVGGPWCGWVGGRPAGLCAGQQMKQVSVVAALDGAGGGADELRAQHRHQVLPTPPFMSATAALPRGRPPSIL